MKLHARAVWLILVLWSAAAAAEVKTVGSLRLLLPTECYAVVGVPMSIYYDNIVLTEKPEDYRFQFQCDVGASEPRRWTVTPGAGDAGPHRLTVSVSDGKGKTLGTAQTTLHVVPAEAGQGKTVRLLIVGDSLTAGGVYAREIARLLSLPGNPAWTMFGTNRRGSEPVGAVHEGYGGWTWARFVSYYDPGKAPPGRPDRSPFVFPAADGKPQLDLPQYFATACKGQTPDFVTIMLGINDCFGAKVDDPKAMDETIDKMFGSAETLLAAFRKAAPQAALGVCLTTPPNARESGFQANYKDKYHRWGWKQIQHRLVERQLGHFGGREAQRIFVVPTELNVDPVDGYPENNGVHPNTAGYNQIGQAIYAWLKWRLAQGKP